MEARDLFQHQQQIPFWAYFDSVTLDKMNSVQLLSRHDTKFLLSQSDFFNIINYLPAHYSILEINHQRIFQYQSLYFDTNDLSLYLKHHNRTLNRHKVRMRKYVDSNQTYLEVKFKSNKQKTIKTRKLIKNMHSTLEPDDFQFIHNSILQQNEIHAHELVSQIYSNYHRLTLVDQQWNERVTLDFNLTFQKMKTKISLPQLVIVEVKQDEASSNSPIIQLLRNYNLHQTSFSKYCIGTVLLQEQIKYNHFKKKILLLDQYGIDIKTHK